MSEKEKNLDADLKEYMKFYNKKRIPEHIEEKIKKEFFKKQYLNANKEKLSYTDELEENIKEFKLTLFLYRNELTPEIEKLFLSLRNNIDEILTGQKKLF